jgi:hypothetical protein
VDLADYQGFSRFVTLPLNCSQQTGQRITKPVTADDRPLSAKSLQPFRPAGQSQIGP